MTITVVQLGGPLAGHSIHVDEDRLTIGMLEDLESGTVKGTIDALSTCIIGGDAVTGDVRQWIRSLKSDGFKAALEAVMGLFRTAT